MLDIAFIRTHPEVVTEAAQHKNVAVDVPRLLELDTQRRELRTTLDTLAQERNALATVGKTGSLDSEQLTRAKALKKEVGGLESQLKNIESELQHLLQAVPNLPTADTPVGMDESQNKVLRSVGTLPTFDFSPKEHWQLGTDLDVIDNERAAQVAGSRFTYLKGGLVWLEFALIQLALRVLTTPDTLQEIAHTNNLNVPTTPFIPVIPPVLIKPEVMQKMARLEPKDERYYIPGDDLYLVGSAEHTLGPLHMNETLTEAQLPLRYTGFSAAFRREAGSYGKDVRGILRMHQFNKLEIESFTLPEAAIAEQDFIVAIQEYCMQLLKLPYQVVLKCTGDMGTPNARAIDIETWLPGQQRYRETHTSDLMTDYQARRLRTKVKRAHGTSEFVHMNDATIFAMGRTLLAIMENYQQADGSILVPDALKAYVPFTALTLH